MISHTCVHTTFRRAGGSGLGGASVEECINSLSIVKDKYIYFGGYSNVDVSPTTSFPVVDDGINNMYVSQLTHATDAVVGRFGFDLTIGLNEISSENHFSIYPNPAYQIVTLEFEKNFKALNELRIYNLLGESMAVKDKIVVNHPNQITIDISELAAGFYIVSINEFTAKLLKQ